MKGKVKVKRGRKAKKDDEKKSEITFNIEEKEGFLKALKENGFNVINDPETIQKYIPKLTINEINFLIDSFKRRGKELANSEDDRFNVAPGSQMISSWYSIINDRVANTLKKDDLSNIFAELFDEFAAQIEPVSSENSVKRTATGKKKANETPDISKIYKYLSDTLKGKYPPELEANESLIVLYLIENVKRMQKCLNLENERKFLKESTRWNFGYTDNEYDFPFSNFTFSGELIIPGNDEFLNETEVTTEEMDQDSIQDDQALVPQSSETNEMDPEADANVYENLLINLIDLPKIRKIRECLNPLNVPQSMLHDEYKCIKVLLKKFT